MIQRFLAEPIVYGSFADTMLLGYLRYCLSVFFYPFQDVFLNIFWYMHPFLANVACLIVFHDTRLLY